MISIIGGGRSDFLSSQLLASSEKVSFSLVFFRMRVSGSRHTYNFVSRLGLLYYNRIEKVVLTTLWSLKRDLFKACYNKSERNEFMMLVEYFPLHQCCSSNFCIYSD